MQTKRFVAADMRRALALVRENLGDDAMILSTQRTKKGVEIVATSDDAPTSTTPSATISELVEMPAAAAAPQTVRIPERGSERGIASGKTKEELALELEMARRRMLAVKKEEKLTIGEWAEQQTPTVQKNRQSIASEEPLLKPLASTQEDSFGLHSTPASGAQSQSTDPVSRTDHSAAEARDNAAILQLQDEIANMRSLFVDQLASMAEAQERRYQDHNMSRDIIPVMATVKQRLEQLGLTRACNDQVIRSLKSLDDTSLNQESLWSEGLARLARKIPALSSDPVATGGIYAFLGTTGVGKTTTIAKLAARHVMTHGPQSVALLTTDTFRIAAHDQLRSLGRILGVQVKVVDDLASLPQLLSRFSRQDLVLIDTPGMSYNDPLLKEHLTALRRCQHVQTALVLSANSQYQMMQASLHSYRIAEPKFCVMTKLDECASLGDAISLLTSNDLPLAYITNGQAVPDDLAVIKPHQLVARAVTLSQVDTNTKSSVSQDV